MRERVHESKVQAFNCSSGGLWSELKTEWCCKSIGIHCPQPTQAPDKYNCSLGLNNWRLEWSPQKKKWCCDHRRQGCPAPGTAVQVHLPARPPPPKPPPLAPPPLIVQPPPPLQPAAVPPVPTLQQPPPAAAAAAPRPPDPFNCAVDAAEWQNKWAPRKKVWCCDVHHLHCPEPPPGTPLLRGQPLPGAKPAPGPNALPPAFAVPTLPPAVTAAPPLLGSTATRPNCQIGLSSWRTSWSPAKRDWCCRHAQLGCLDVL